MIRDIRRAALVIVVILVVLPTLFVVLRSTTQYESPGHHWLRYSETVKSKPNVKEIFSRLGGTLNPDELRRLSGILGGIALASNETGYDPLSAYLSTLANLSSRMTEIEISLKAAQAALQSGDRQQATLRIAELKKSQVEASHLLNSAEVLLNKVGAQYQFDTTIEKQKIATLQETLLIYTKQIEALQAALNTDTNLISTSIILNVTMESVYVNQTFIVYGILQDQNATALPGRNITVLVDSREVVRQITDLDGRFQSSLNFSIGSQPGTKHIEAVYQPQGADANLYQPSSAFVDVQVNLRPSVIKADLTPTNVKPEDFISVNGTLAGIDGNPLVNRTIELRLDDRSIAEVLTGPNGIFSYTLIVPSNFESGTYTVNLEFRPQSDLYGPSNATLPFILEVLDSIIQINPSSTSSFSGLPLTMSGVLTYSNGSAIRAANITVYFDFAQYSVATSDSDGRFQVTVRLPVDLQSGMHVVQMQYSPADRGVRATGATALVLVYSTPLLMALAASIALAATTSVYLARTGKKQIARTVGIQAPPTSPPAPQKLTTARIISAIKSEIDNASQVRRCYQLAQQMIEENLGESPHLSETPEEYLTRISKAFPSLKKNLARIVNLFELAEYSPYPIKNEESNEAREIVLQLALDLEAVK